MVVIRAYTRRHHVCHRAVSWNRCTFESGCTRASLFFASGSRAPASTQQQQVSTSSKSVQNHWMRAWVAFVALAVIFAVTAWFVEVQRYIISQALPTSETVASMGLSYPAPDIITPTSTLKPAATVILLHGLGDTAAGWKPLGMQMQDALPHVKWIFPTAPMRAITCNMGMKMPGWYDIYSFEGLNSKEDSDGVNESARYVKQLIDQEVKAGTPPNRIVVAGFSQGGAVALMSLRQTEGLAGVVGALVQPRHVYGQVEADHAGLSCYLPLRNELTILLDGAKSTPVFLGHGSSDPLVPIELGEMSKDMLEAKGLTVDFRKYPMAHSACPEELQDVAAFLARVLS